jgi:hypothetical protein
MDGRNHVIAKYLAIDKITHKETRFKELWRISLIKQKLTLSTEELKDLNERISPHHKNYGTMYPEEPTPTTK